MDCARWGFILLMPLVVQAQTIYKCVDSTGRTLTADRPIAECAGRATKEFDKFGVLRREVPALPSAAEKQQQIAQEESRKAATALTDQRGRSDRAILMRYRAEADILRARKRALEPLQEQARREQAALAKAELALRKIEMDAAALAGQASQTPPSAEFRQQLDDARQIIDERKKALFAREVEITAVQSKYAQTLTRYRELNLSEQTK